MDDSKVEQLKATIEVGDCNCWPYFWVYHSSCELVCGCQFWWEVCFCWWSVVHMCVFQVFSHLRFILLFWKGGGQGEGERGLLYYEYRTWWCTCKGKNIAESCDYKRLRMSRTLCNYTKVWFLSFHCNYRKSVIKEEKVWTNLLKSLELSNLWLLNPVELCAVFCIVLRLRRYPLLIRDIRALKHS